MSGADAFFDTNVLLYLVSADARKADVAEALLANGGHVSVQVLNEFASVARRKAGLSWSEIGELLDHVRQVCTVHPLTVDVHDVARGLAERYRLAFYDALIVASAVKAGCAVLLSEDLQGGQRFAGGVRVRDPFSHS
ncbi:MAG TPA: PIN domain-containing protein [Rubrivivax sp.]|nr:PIN domain-containing protein [Rubrivivax sp.]